MHSRTLDNDPFYSRVVQNFYKEATARHPKFPLIRRMQYGFALCQLPKTTDDYFAKIEASARRNHKKAVREGCSFRRINFNDHLQEIADIRKSTDVRQGKHMPAEFLNGEIKAINDPPSLSNVHDYPYHGIFYQDKLIGYIGSLIAGELGGIQQIYGHANHLTLGVVPQLIIGFAGELCTHYPHVKYMSYGTYYGAGETMRRFKRKFLMFPHHVKWELG